MSYVRTKYGGILKLTEKGCIKEIYGTMYAFLEKGLSHHLQNGFEIIAQADTIEELCDFVDIQYFDNSWETYLFEKTFRIKLLFNKAKQVFYGIRTDKGLIYVAKMNEKGELELL